MSGRRPKNPVPAWEGKKPYESCLHPFNAIYLVSVVEKKSLAHRNVYAQGTCGKTSDRAVLKSKEPRLRD